MNADDLARRERARIAANTRWAKPGAREQQSRALRAAMRERLAREVDPDGVMAPDELAAAIANAGQLLSARLRVAWAAKRGQS